ncbi:tetratricopeptide repeat protein, partial [Vibrio crassostreae]
QQVFIHCATTTDKYLSVRSIIEGISLVTIKDVVKVGGILTFALGTGVAGYNIVDNWVENKINNRIAPYEQLISGIALVQDAEYDDAVEVLEKAISGLTAQKMDEQRRKAVIDHYLTAIVNSEDITQHSPDFNKLEEQLKLVPQYGWHLHNLGWYHLRTNDVDKAEDYFDHALDKYREDQEYREMADSYWALSIVALINQDMKKSIEYTLKAEEANPLGYSLEDWLKDKDAMKLDPWFSRLMRIYPAYGQLFDEWVKEVEKLVGERKT